ncbi:MAG: Na(+)-translocating NADH-quinone reductase subunit A [Leptospirales bacterium]
MSNNNVQVPAQSRILNIKKGLDLKIKGAPEQTISEGPSISKVAVMGEYHFMKPTFQVKLGDQVKLGQVLFTDRNNTDIHYTSPGAGKVVEINRGDRRVFQSVVIELSGDAEITFEKYAADKLSSLSREQVQKNLLTSGLWTSIRNRPFSNVAKPDVEPTSMFITATDTHPHAPDPELIISENEQDFKNGVIALSRLTDGPTYVARAAGSKVPVVSGENIADVQVTGQHPAGNVGTHIHMIDPVERDHNIWHAGYQDVIAIGHLFTTGKISTDRVISVAGPAVNGANLIRTRRGASIDEIIAGRLAEGEIRTVSGSLLTGHKAAGPMAYLGQYHNQVSALKEGRHRKLFGWLTPRFDLFSVKKVFGSALTPGKVFDFDTNQNGGHRAMVPIGSYEKVMPLDILPTFLLRALLMHKLEDAENLGAMELDEEDLALCTFVSPGKDDFGIVLRENLMQIEKEG